MIFLGNGHPRHRLPIRWTVERKDRLQKPVICARCVMPGGAEYMTWHTCTGMESPLLLWLLIETLTLEILQVCGTSTKQPVGLMNWAQAECK